MRHFLLEIRNGQDVWLLSKVVVAPSFRMVLDTPIFTALLSVPTARVRPLVPDDLIEHNFPADLPVIVITESTRTVTTVGEYIID